MAIVAFWSDENKETGQTLSLVALSTYMAIEHNYKILNVSTNFKDTSLEDCYWERKDETVAVNSKGETVHNNSVGLSSGIEGLVKVIRSNKTTPNIVSTYARAVFKDRLDVLCSPKTTVYDEYREIARMYPEILTTANRYYDVVFVDISSRMGKEEVDRILEVADAIVVNITQSKAVMHKFYQLRQDDQFFKSSKIILNIGRYDGYSKYNVKNVSNYIGIKDVLSVPYNTLFSESCSDGKVAEYFLRFLGYKGDDRNHKFIEQVSKMNNDLIYKLQALQIKM